MTAVSRRRALSLAGLGAVGAASAVGVSGSVLRAGPAAASAAVPFYGTHQAGIVTPAQDRLHFVSFDVITSDRAELADLLREWTRAAARMTGGHDAGLLGAAGGAAEAPPADTGEA
ncbi:MAG TPA: Dyp-type peroxidase domain-containing protein, partial [Micromonosporaceae bacterium]|nr:Dyp-type peroxidase domain-containing protein [Micromonosporaceae bacterium]